MCEECLIYWLKYYTPKPISDKKNKDNGNIYIILFNCLFLLLLNYIYIIIFIAKLKRKREEEKIKLKKRTIKRVKSQQVALDETYM